MAYVYQEFPKWKYHATKGSKIVQNVAEEKALGRGWRDKPMSPTPSRFSAFLDQRVKPWWTRWLWIPTGIAILLGILAAIVSLLRPSAGK